MADTQKSTIYIDIDDEITGIIDKVRSSDGKILALVLPKRAAVFQSVVNMKLLKRSADEAKKHLVLITSEAGLLPLAGSIGIHVAKTLATKPEIPLAPNTDFGPEETVEETAELEDPDSILGTNAASDTPVGELAGLSASAPLSDEMETLELDNEEPADAAAAATGAAAAAKAAKPSKVKKPKKDKKLHIPNFNRFRVLLVIGLLLLIALIVALYFALAVAPRATISVQTDASNINTNVKLTLSPAAQSLDTTDNMVPAKQVTEQKTYTGSSAASGQKNNGNKAAGSITMTAQECGTPTPASDVPAGTGVSVNGQTYITQEDVSFNPTKIKGGCIYFNASGSTSITAQNAGAAFNVPGNTSFSVAGRNDVSATGQASDGTDDIQQIVTQGDINTATSKIASQNTAKQDLTGQLQQDNLYPISVTYSAGTPITSTSTSAGSAATSVTVTQAITYTMYGARSDDLKTLIDNNIKSQVDTNKQSILNDGLSNATFTSNNPANTNLSMATTAEVGPNIDVALIKQQAAGKKTGDIQAAVKNDPDVTGATVKFSPFWVSSAPKNTSKITVTIAKPTISASNASN